MTRVLEFLNAGELPDAVVRQFAFRNFVADPISGPGYKFHPRRSNRGDRILTRELAKLGWSPRKQAHFLVSRWGRHAGDAVTFATVKAERLLARLFQQFDHTYEPSAYAELETAQ